MRPRRLTVLLSIGVIGLAILLLGLRHYGVSRKGAETRPVDPRTMQEMLRKRGESVLKRKAALPLITIYEKMLVQYPESLDLKKKLAAAYEEAGEQEKAQKLLDEINKKAPLP